MAFYLHHAKKMHGKTKFAWCKTCMYIAELLYLHRSNKQNGL